MTGVTDALEEEREGAEGWGGRALSKALPVRRGDWNRKKRSPRLAVFSLRCGALWSPLLWHAQCVPLQSKATWV